MRRLCVCAVLVATPVLLLGCGNTAPGAGVATGPPAGTQLASRFLVTVSSQASPWPPRSEIVGANGHVVRVVANQVGSVKLSPNGGLIAWDGKGGIRVEDVNGASNRVVVRFPCPSRSKNRITVDVCGGPFVWSPDSRELLFVEGNAGLAVVSLATGVRHQIVAPQKHVTYGPIAWSGPADQILFTANNGGDANGIGCCAIKLVIASPSGGNQRILYSAAEAIHDDPAPSWSPNGKWISFTTDGRAPGDPRLAIVTAATGTTKAVRSFNGFTEVPVWAPTSNHFALGGYQAPLVIYTPTGKKLRSLNLPSADVRAWTRSGLYFLPGGSTNTGPRHLLVIPSGQHTARTVFTVPKSQVILTIQPI